LNLFEAEVLAKQLISDYVPAYRFAWNSFKSVNGRCVYAERTIYLSRHLTEIRTEQAVKTTIMHEIAHAMHPGKGHGPVWKAQMRAFGLPDSRCSDDQPDRSSISNWRAQCRNCGKVSFFIRKPRVQRSCGKCSGTVYNPKYALNFVRI
jgi:predicted SprT family Zn-dependent metalloprotease